MNKLSLSLLLALLVGLSATGARAQGLADTPENRQTQAARYLAAMPPKELFATMTKAVVSSVPAGPQREKLLKMITTGVDLDAIGSAQKDAMVKHLTADEIKALADFYGSPLGRSAMSKMGDVTADMMPVIQAQVMNAMSQGGAAHP